MRTAFRLSIPLLLYSLRDVASLSTSSSPNDASPAPLSTKDRVLEQSYATKTALRQHILSDDDLVQGMENYEKICEIPATQIIDHTLCTAFREWSSQSEHLKPWASIRRGSDLFLKGLGGFNIPETYGKLVQYRHKEWKESVLESLSDSELKRHCKSLGIEVSKKTHQALTTDLARQSNVDVVQIAMDALRRGTLKESYLEKGKFHRLSNLLEGQASTYGLPYWFVTVSLLQNWGYFGNVLEKMTSMEVLMADIFLRHILRGDEDSPLRQHLIKYHHSWSEQENLASLHEIFISGGPEGDGFWPEGWERMQPSVLLNSLRQHEREKELARRGGDVTYSHLSELEDSESLRVLRSTREVMDVGLALNNCALSYAKSVELEECILIAKYDDVKKNKPIALGMIHRNGNGLAGRWSQIYLSCNRAAPEEVKEEFYDYEAVLRPWFRKKYSETEDNP